MALVTAKLIPDGNPAWTGGAKEYRTMSAAESAEQTDLTGGDQFELVCYEGTIQDVCTWDGWTTGDGNGILIRANAGDEHKGVVGDGFIMNNANNAASESLRLIQSWMTVQDFTVSSTGSTIGTTGIDSASTNGLIQRMIVDIGGTSIKRCFRLFNNSPQTVRNCLATSSTLTAANGSYAFSIATANITIQNCSSIGFKDSSNPVQGFDGAVAQASRSVTNAVSDGGIGFDPNTVNSTFNNNASFDLTAVGAGCITGVVEGDFVNYAGGDYTPAAGNQLDGTVNPGVDYSITAPDNGFGGTFSDDITGSIRTAPWDIGAYAIAGAPPAVTFDGPDIVAQTGTENVLFSFNENGEGTVASRFTAATSYALAPTSDALPTGLTVNPTTGNIEGTPTEVATRNIIIEGSD